MTTSLIPQDDFTEISQLIAAARQRAVQAVNTELIELYWQIGKTISRKIERAEWGDGVVAKLAEHLAKAQPGLRGFTRANLFRMRQFFLDSKPQVKLPFFRSFALIENDQVMRPGQLSHQW